MAESMKLARKLCANSYNTSDVRLSWRNRSHIFKKREYLNLLSEVTSYDLMICSCIEFICVYICRKWRGTE